MRQDLPNKQGVNHQEQKDKRILSMFQGWKDAEFWANPKKHSTLIL